jgi:hypothetical protein
LAEFPKAAFPLSGKNPAKTKISGIRWAANECLQSDFDAFEKMRRQLVLF